MTIDSFQFRQMAWASILIFGLLIPAPLRADDWPQWRGPNRDGVWGETGIMSAFPVDGVGDFLGSLNGNYVLAAAAPDEE